MYNHSFSTHIQHLAARSNPKPSPASRLATTATPLAQVSHISVKSAKPTTASSQSPHINLQQRQMHHSNSRKIVSPNRATTISRDDNNISPKAQQSSQQIPVYTITIDDDPADGQQQDAIPSSNINETPTEAAAANSTERKTQTEASPAEVAGQRVAHPAEQQKRPMIKTKSRPKKNERIIQEQLQSQSQSNSSAATKQLIKDNGSNNSTNNHKDEKKEHFVSTSNHMTEQLKSINKASSSSSIHKSTSFDDTTEQHKTQLLAKSERLSSSIGNIVRSHSSATIKEPTVSSSSPIKIQPIPGSAAAAIVNASPNRTKKIAHLGTLALVPDLASATAIKDNSKMNPSPAPTTTSSRPSGVDEVANRLFQSKSRAANGLVTPKPQTEPKALNPITNSAKKIPLAPIFSWDVYLNIAPALVAPKEAFMQSHQPLKNLFLPAMRLEARDPRSDTSWCLASVVGVYGSRIRLRFDGDDDKNDFFELIDSANIRPVGADPNVPLLPPMGYQGNISNYPKFVEKVLSKPNVIIAPPNCFSEPPKMPEKNLFESGMKIEAVDKKNPDLICPATIGEVYADKIRIIFDGWRGSFDYSCKYYSRDIFPVNWCFTTGHYIQPPNGWEGLIRKGSKKSEDDEESDKSPAKHITPSPTRSIPSKNGPTVSKITSPKIMQPSQFKTVKNVERSLAQKTPKANGPASASKPRPMQSTPKTDKTRLQNNIDNQSTKISNTSITSEAPDSLNVSMTSEHVIEKRDNEMEEFTPDTDKFQCQRTIPFSEWRKTKLDRVLNASRDMIEDSDDVMSSIINPDESTSLASEIVCDLDSQYSSKPESHISKKLRLDTGSELSNEKLRGWRNWTVSDTLNIMREDETLAKYAYVFSEHEIDGKAFILLTTEVMTKLMGLKVGPALKIIDIIEQIKRLE